MKTGTFRADALTLHSVAIDFSRGGVGLTARAGFVHTGSGVTHGWTETATWSTRTLQAIEALKEAMETDLAAHHFHGGDGALPTAPAREGGGGLTIASPPRGIGDDLTPDDAQPL